MAWMVTIQKKNMGHIYSSSDSDGAATKSHQRWKWEGGKTYAETSVHMSTAYITPHARRKGPKGSSKYYKGIVIPLEGNGHNPNSKVITITQSMASMWSWNKCQIPRPCQPIWSCFFFPFLPFNLLGISDGAQFI